MMASVLDTFPFAVFVVSVLSTKLLHLFTHLTSIPLLNFIFYLPSFLIPDVIFICTARILLRRTSILSAVGYAVALGLSLITLGAAASELGFYIETGGEINWRDAGAFAGDKEGMKVLMDGVKSVGISLFAIVLIAWCLKGLLHRVVGEFLFAVGHYVVSVLRCISGRSSRKNVDLEVGDDASTVHSDRDTMSEFDAHEGQRFLSQDGEKPQEPQASPKRPRRGFTVLAILTAVYLMTVALTRPEKPYNHLTSTLPWPLLDVYQPAADPCAEKILLSQNQWPLPELITKPHWKKAKGHFKGWAPGAISKDSKAYKAHHPDWLPKPAPKGFDRWDPEQPQDQEFVLKPGQAENKEHEADHETCAVNVTEHKFYSPVMDPMRITNLDTEILAPLKKVMHDNSVKIKHVVYILMESMREELFPLQQGSDFHNMILNTHEDDEQREIINMRTANLTPNSERITGKPGNFADSDGTPYATKETTWKDQTKPGFGGINVVGAYTPSSVSTKSLAAGHCGVWPLPVDKFEEAGLKAYQPCLPQILELFNRQKDENKTSDDFLEQEWAPAFFQATTDHYDRQYVFDDYMGFKHVVTKKVLGEKRLGGDIQEIHYFGYPESALKPYLHEYINKTLSEKKRMFLSHFTSTTHHPWATPKNFDNERYLSLQDGQWHNDMNKYLNTVRYCDAWLGEVMQMLDDYGVSNETLVVFVGDHGQAFKEDTKKSGTYENGHVSNYRVPITLRHPNLPRVQYEANATSLSLLPTILDLLINTHSLNFKDTSIAADLIQDYEGQSLIRPYKTNEDGRRAWNFGLVNAGGGMLTVGSADAPWRLVMPLGLQVAYTVTDVKKDPLELDPVSAWTMDALLPKVEGKLGAEAAVWAKEAEAVARWWIVERKRLWGYQKK